MSYFAFLARSSVSATYFTVIGNVCKVLTVLINICIWDKHATPKGVGFLFICLLAAFFYKPSPLRSVPDTEAEEEAQGLVEDDEAETEMEMEMEMAMAGASSGGKPAAQPQNK